MGIVEKVVSAVPDARGINLYRADRDAQALFAYYLPADLFRHLDPHFDRLGALAGGRLDELASVADRNPPQLHVRRRTGEDWNHVEKHPAYVEMERLGYSEFGLAALSHRGGVLGWPTPMPPAAKYALTYLFVQAEFGLCCPISMTDSLTRTLRRYGDPALVERYFGRLTSLDFDEYAQGAMFMTEQGAGSDVAATTTRADLQADGTWRLTGDKWFCSNVDADFAMVLARSEGKPGLKGISLFLLPKVRQDGTPNAYRILRLKDKLGTRSMASGEVRLEGAEAYLVGERGRGFNQMADMINNSRLSNGMRAAGLMRRATTEAFFIAGRRHAFGRAIGDLPLMRRQLAKLLVTTEQARTMMFMTADALHRANEGNGFSASVARIMTPLIKFRACRDARRVTGDAMEVRGGCGYIEEWSDPRLVRDAHLGSIWEGTSNIVALDVMRATVRDDALTALRTHLVDMLDAAALEADDRRTFGDVLERTCRFADGVARSGDEMTARQAASALYNITTAIGLARESVGANLPHRMALAKLVLLHRLQVRDPLAPPADEALVETALAGAFPGPSAHP